MKMGCTVLYSIWVYNDPNNQKLHCGVLITDKYRYIFFLLQQQKRDVLFQGFSSFLDVKFKRNKGYGQSA